MNSLKEVLIGMSSEQTRQSEVKSVQKVMLLAAGKGERMQPLTTHIPKPLLRAGEYSLIEHQLLKLARAGFQDIVINHAWLGAKLESTLGDGSKYGVNISWSPEIEPLETAGGIIHALGLLGAFPFLVVNGDVWTDYPFANLRHALKAQYLAHLVLVPNPPQHRHGDFALTDTGRVQLREEGSPSKTFTYSGIAVYHPQFFRGNYPERCALLPLLEKAIVAGQVSGEIFNGQWLDIGTPERLQALQDQLAGKRLNTGLADE
jgi:MurNAc alpha-1-phosphate uridylyltransferase